MTKLDYLEYLVRVYLLRQGTLGMGRSWRDPAIVDDQFLNDPSGDGIYPIDFSRDDVPDLLTDGCGIPMIDYANLGIHYNPWFVGHIALGRYTKWKRSQVGQYKDSFIKLANWFLEHATLHDGGTYWFYYFKWFHHQPPWFSALSQAHAISVLIRASCITGDARYAEMAEGATRTMIAPLGKGGTASNEADGSVCFQESIILPPTYILNGHLFSCIAAYEASQFFGYSDFISAAEQGIMFVQKNIRKFDLGYWSRYSMKNVKSFPDIASPHYHDVHIAQLNVMYVITQDQLLLEMSRRFRNYQNSYIYVKRALWLKRFVKVLAYHNIKSEKLL